MVRAGSLTAMTLHVVPIQGGQASLGTWGSLQLSGSTSAVLRPAVSEDVDVPESVAWDLPGGVLLLNDELGRLLFLPYAGDMAISYDLENGLFVEEPHLLPRSPDRGLRMATVRLVPELGAVYLTESTLALFRDDCTLSWRHDENFSGFTIVAITHDEVRLLASDWDGHEERQRRALLDGTKID